MKTFYGLVDLLRSCYYKRISLDEFSRRYISLFSDPDVEKSLLKRNGDTEKILSSLYLDCGQFQPDPILLCEISKGAPPNFFFGPEIFQLKVEEAFRSLQNPPKEPTQP